MVVYAKSPHTISNWRKLFSPAHIYQLSITAMGLDGGTIPTRGELVQVKKKPEQKDKVADTLHKWSNCTITQAPLEKPILLCHLGMLFNKKSILEMLLGKSSAAKCKQFQHIESLRDVRELQLTDNRSHGTSGAAYICPVTGLEMNGKHKFVCLWECGCVLSDRAVKEVLSNQCHKCGRDYVSTDLVVINPTDEEFEILKDRMEHRKTTRKAKHVQAGSKQESKGHGPSSTSDVSVTNKRAHNDSRDNEHTTELKSKKVKKEHKHKKGKKHKKEKKHKRTDVSCGSSTTERPQIHPGWSNILNRR